MTSSERQRQFRERNPDYFRTYHAKRAAERKLAFAAMQDAQRVEAIRAMMFPKMPLMLPAPVVSLEMEALRQFAEARKLEQEKTSIRP